MAAPLPEGTLVYSVREWDGEYFSRDGPGGVETSAVRSALWRINADGAGRQGVPVPGVRAEHPLASPDGRWIYWQTESAGRWRIHRLRPDGTELMTIAPWDGMDDGRTSAFGAVLSADGSHLTFTLHDGVAGKVVLARADGSGARVLAPEFGYSYMASPDANAKRVVFSGPARGYRLVLMEVAGGAPSVLTPEHPDSYAPQFTLDGRAVIFIRHDGKLYRVAPDGTGLKQLADGVQVEFRLSAGDAHGSTDVPALAPDGQCVAFVARDAAGGVNVFTVALDGSDRRQVTRLPGGCGRVQWSPDGGWLAFVSFVGGKPQLFVTRADGSTQPRQLTQDRGAVYALSWLPA